MENARRKSRLKHGGVFRKIDLPPDALAVESIDGEVLAIDEALDDLARVDSQAGELVKLRYFGGLGAEEAGELLELSPRSTYRCWAFAKAWLYARLVDVPSDSVASARYAGSPAPPPG